MKFRYAFFSILMFIVAANTKSQPVHNETPWHISKKIFHSEFTWLCNSTVRDELSSIYDIQVYTNNLLVRAEQEADFNIIDSIAAIILRATTTLRETNYYPTNSYNRLDSAALGRSYRMWLFPRTLTIGGVKITTREEYHLSSSQFLFLAAQVLRAGISLPEGLYPHIDSLIQIYPEILLEHHYQRWIIDTKTFRLSGWGCAKGMFNHKEFLMLKNKRKFLFKPEYCPVITDADMFIIAGLAQVLAANRTDSVRIIISPGHLDAYREYLKVAEDVLQSRISLRPVSTGQGTVEGFALDNGLYRKYSDHRYALYTGEEFPSDKLKTKLSDDAAWDVSHARRFFFIFHSLLKVKGQAGLTLDYERYLKGLAHQFYHVIYLDTARHLFANYINGDNGWYRVNYHGEGSGFPPHSMSIAAITGGYFFLGNYYQPINDLAVKLWRYINENPEYYNRYYGVVYRNYKPVYRTFNPDPSGSERFILLQWLPSVMLNSEE